MNKWLVRLIGKWLEVPDDGKRTCARGADLESGFWDFILVPVKDIGVGLGLMPVSKNQESLDSGFVDSRIDWDRYARIEREQAAKRHKR